MPNVKSCVAPVPRWCQLLRESIQRNAALKPVRDYAQLATIEEETVRPRNRTVVVRGWHDSTTLIITTDIRSRKVQESCKGELCWYFQESREQYRLSVDLLYVPDAKHRNLCNTARLLSEASGQNVQPARKALWEGLGEDTKDMWTVNGQPGSPDLDSSKCSIDEGFQRFVLVLARVYEVDLVDLKARTRIFWDKEGRESRVNP